MAPLIAAAVSSAASSAASSGGKSGGSGLMDKIGSAANAPGKIVSLAIQAYAAIKQAKEMKKQQKLLNAQKRFNDLWYSGEYNKDYFRSDEARSALKFAQDAIKKNIQRIQGASAITGMSDESIAANNANGMAAMGNQATQIAARGDQRKDRVQSMYFDRRGNLEVRQANIDAGNIAKWDNLKANAGNIASAFNVVPTSNAPAATAAPAAPVANNQPINISMPSTENGQGMIDNINTGNPSKPQTIYG